MAEAGTDDHGDGVPPDRASSSSGADGAGRSGPTDPDDVVRALEADRAGVEAVARAVVGSGSPRLTDWSVVPLGGGQAGNPTTGGLFRVAGHVDTGERWTAVLKVVRSPVGTAWPSDVPDEGIYWRREVELARSRLLDGVRGLVPPRTYATAERSAASAWVWMEDLGDLVRPGWSDADYVVAARALARFHAPYLTGTPVPDAPWLSTDLTRRFHASVQPYYRELMSWAAGGPSAFAPLRPDGDARGLAAVHRVMTAPEPLLSAVDRSPRVLCHGDANVDNLVIRTRPDGSREVVALDWQMAGPASIGCDLGQLLAGARPTDRAARDRTVAVVLRAYLDELLAAGAEVDAPTVELAWAADAAVRQTAWAFLRIHLGVGGVRTDGRDALVATWAREVAAGGLTDLVRHAWELVARSRAAAP